MVDRDAEVTNADAGTAAKDSKSNKEAPPETVTLRIFEDGDFDANRTPITLDELRVDARTSAAWVLETRTYQKFHSRMCGKLLMHSERPVCRG